MRAPVRSLVASCLLVAACAAPDSTIGSAQIEVTDSAGIRVVTHAGDLVGDPLPLRPVWEHGYGPEDYPFQGVFVGDLQPDGGAVLADGGNREVVLISADGSSHALLAQTGQGPGEVTLPRGIVVTGQDTVWVEDIRAARITRFDDGEVAVTLNRTLTGRMTPFGSDDGGRILLRTGSFSTRFEEPWLAGHVARLDPRASTLDTMFAYPMAPRTDDTNRNPFAPFGHAVAVGDGVAHARSDVPEIVWRDSAGGITQIIRWSPRLDYPTEATWERFVVYYREQLARFNPQNTGADLEAMIDRMLPTYSVDESVPLPLFGIVVGASDGSLWLPEYLPTGAPPATYLVLSSDGTAISSVTFDRPTTVISVRPPFVLGIHEDDLGVQTATVHRYAENS